jgi:hypothetical protein
VGGYGEVVTWEQDEAHEYRYVRVWDHDLPVLLFVMLNPAAGEASSTLPDVTTRRCVGYARREGFGGIRFVNLFTYRATHPAELWVAAEPNGPGADEHLAAALGEAGGRAVVGWGSHHGTGMAERVDLVRRLAGDAGVELLCVRRNADGAPGHPSRGAYLPLQSWP